MAAAATVRTQAASTADAARAQAAAGGDWVMDAVARLGAPQAPVTQPWEISLSRLLGAHPRVPSAVARPLRLLDRLGAIHLAPQSVGFDGESVPWEKVTEIRMVGGYRLLTREFIDTALDGIRGALWGVPGREWVLGRAAEALTGLVMSQVQRGGGAFAEVLVPGEIVHRGRFGRSRSLSASLYPTAFLLASPGVVESFTATARARGVTVSAPPVGEAPPFDPSTLPVLTAAAVEGAAPAARHPAPGPAEGDTSPDRPTGADAG
ncbi:hypothetical protein [Actinacidiphila sp. bgisy145]|uniref:hypothetical protein n=1 Tax=Actinacidiphila sp. bgisy145 TaxID=3413792 RepID=UPI003EC0D50F